MWKYILVTSCIATIIFVASHTYTTLTQTSILQVVYKIFKDFYLITPFVLLTSNFVLYSLLVCSIFNCIKIKTPYCLGRPRGLFTTHQNLVLYYAFVTFLYDSHALPVDCNTIFLPAFSSVT